MYDTTRRIAGMILGACLAMGTAVAPAAAAESSQQQTTKQVAQLKVEIKQETGSVAKKTSQVEWNEDAALVFEGAQHKHDVGVKLVRESDKSSKVKITLSYTRDGESIIAPYTVDTRVKKREVIRIEGGLAIALTVTPKKIKVEAPKEKRPDFNPGEGNDPLSGL